jgi:hypothetical protein
MSYGTETNRIGSKPYLQDFGRFLSRFFVPLLLSQLNLGQLGSQIFLPVKKISYRQCKWLFILKYFKLF